MYSFSCLNKAYQPSPGTGSIKRSEQDFIVDEIMPIEPSGQGEHLWIHLRKTACNTEWLARQLANWAQVKPMSVSYAGLKDRHGVTSQWFSIHLPGQADPDFTAFNLDGVEVLNHRRHERKLKRGALSGNAFTLHIRDITADPNELEGRLNMILQQGVPNYFGEQRFGHNMNNLKQAERLFQGELKRVKRHLKSLYLSAARSWLFNLVLSERIARGNWNRLCKGDVLMLAGSNACFRDDGSEDLQTRIDSAQLHSTGPLWGRGGSMAEHDCASLEQNMAKAHSLFSQGLEASGMKQERRSLRLMPEQMSWQWHDDKSLELKFTLTTGSYATMLVRELVSSGESTPFDFA